MTPPKWIKIHTDPSALQKELDAFDASHHEPLPPALQKWRKRWLAAIEREKKTRYHFLGGILPIDRSSDN